MALQMLQMFFQDIVPQQASWLPQLHRPGPRALNFLSCSPDVKPPSPRFTCFIGPHVLRLEALIVHLVLNLLLLLVLASSYSSSPPSHHHRLFLLHRLCKLPNLLVLLYFIFFIFVGSPHHLQIQRFSCSSRDPPIQRRVPAHPE